MHAFVSWLTQDAGQLNVWELILLLLVFAGGSKV